MISLHPDVVKVLKTLKFREDASITCCLQPLGGIRWSDELPDLHASMMTPREARSQFYVLLSIRCKIWKGDKLSTEEQLFWDDARAAAPEYAAFRRLEPTDKIKMLQQECEEEAEDAFNSLLESHDVQRIEDSVHGMGKLSMRLKSEKKQQGYFKTLWGVVLRALFGNRGH